MPVTQRHRMLGESDKDDTALEEAIIAALDASPVIGAAAAQEAADGLPRSCGLATRH